MVCETSLAAAVVSLYGKDVRVVAKEPVYGGDINQSYCLSLSDGTPVFLKCNTLNNLSFFAAETRRSF